MACHKQQMHIEEGKEYVNIVRNTWKDLQGWVTCVEEEMVVPCFV